MKSRIIEVIEKEYGEKVTKWYDVQHFSRSYGGMFLCLILPIYGWIALFVFRPYQLKWRTVESLDTKKQAEYYLKNEEKYVTIERVVS